MHKRSQRPEPTKVRAATKRPIASLGLTFEGPPAFSSKVLRYHPGVKDLSGAVGSGMDEGEDGCGEGRDTYEPLQLGLFSPGRNEAEAAFGALESLEFECAERLFRSMLERDLASSDATTGLEAVDHWRGVHASLDQAGPMERARVVWCAVRECPPRLITRNLRRRMLEEVLELLEMRYEVMPVPNLCAGEVLLELGRIGPARSWFTWAVRLEPEVALVHLLFGDTLWVADSAGEARSCYSRGMYLDPTLERWRSAAWPELAHHVRAVGGVATALEWWAAGRLPLPKTDVDGEPHSEVEEVWRVLSEAEAARRQGRHDEMVRLRLALRDLAPDVFATYLASVEAS